MNPFLRLGKGGAGLAGFSPDFCVSEWTLLLLQASVSPQAPLVSAGVGDLRTEALQHCLGCWSFFEDFGLPGPPGRFCRMRMGSDERLLPANAATASSQSLRVMKDKDCIN